MILTPRALGRPSSGGAITGTTKAEVHEHVLKLPSQEALYREPRCRAAIKNRWTRGKESWYRCGNFAMADIFVETEDLFDEEPRIGLCGVHAGVSERGNLVITR